MRDALDRRTLLALAGAGLLVPPRLTMASAAPAVPRPTREAMVPVPGGRLYVRVDGDLAGPRPPLLMIHGGPGGSHYAFVRALPLAAERAVILYDQLDCGRSEGPMDAANWTVPRFVAEIEAIRAALGIARWHVLGHSWGGTLALEHAATAPSGLASVTLSSPLIATPLWLDDARALVATLPAATRRTLAACEAGTATPADCEAANTVFEGRFYMRRPRAPEVLAYRDTLPRSFTPPLYNAMWGPTEFRCTGTLKAYDGTPLLARLPAGRTLFVTGEHDEARPATVRGLADRAKARFAVIPGAGHSTLNDDRDAWLAAVSAHLRACDA